MGSLGIMNADRSSGHRPTHRPRRPAKRPSSRPLRRAARSRDRPSGAIETEIRIEPLLDHLATVATVIGWHWTEFGYEDPGGSAASWRADLLATLQRDRVPLALVALDGPKPVGSAELIEHDLDSRRDLSPWLAGVYVAPAYRRAGLGRRLVRTIEGRAADLGFSCLFCFTEDAAEFYVAIGWQRYAEAVLQGRAVTILRRELSPSARGSSRVGRVEPEWPPGADGTANAE
ncbi:MAG: GNAT family N-acetyltransferase [Thermoplasmata archaeon]|nr:GNAT family N-acetyltransferase [Thermoplasmata archaeon]